MNKLTTKKYFKILLPLKKLLHDLISLEKKSCYLNNILKCYL
jgi:hypothetical protein